MMIFMSLLCFVVSEPENIDIEVQYIKEMDNLYSELLNVEESISKSLRKLQLLKKMQTNLVK